MTDYVIIGAGLFGATVARQLMDAGHNVTVVDKRAYIGGNCADELRDGIRISLHGGHAFHTNSPRIWEYVNRFSAWQQYEHRVKAQFCGTMYSFPPNLMTCEQLGVIAGTERAERVIKETFFRGYTEKQWSRPLEDVPGAVTARIPIRTTWDDRYFDDLYQGLPVDGYSAMIARMLDGADVITGREWRRCDQDWRPVIYTGPLDALYGYDMGRLEWRSLTFQTERLEMADWQGCATVNYTAAEIPFTRIMEWRHWWRAPKTDYTYVTHEWPAEYTGANEPYYPIGDDKNRALYRQYRARAEADGYHVGGRLGGYAYLNMDQAIGAALMLAEKLTHG